MKYTIKSFIQNLVGNRNTLEYLEVQEGSKLYLIWNGLELRIISENNYLVDNFNFWKESPRNFKIDLFATNYWNFTIKFSDQGIIKNKKYWLRDYIK